jgi:ribosome maturation factor RimP
MSDMLAKAAIDRRIAALILPTVEAMGFQLVRVRLMGGKRVTLQIMAERPDGRMEVEDCADLSRALSALLDVEDPIDREYTLEVSSPGIDRPLTRPEDFARWAGWVAKLETDMLVDGRKRWKGELKGIAEGVVTIATDTGDGAIPFEALTDAKLVLTDELIAATLKAQKDKGFDESKFDEIEVEEPDDAEDGDDAARPAERETPKP